MFLSCIIIIPQKHFKWAFQSLACIYAWQKQLHLSVTGMQSSMQTTVTLKPCGKTRLSPHTLSYSYFFSFFQTFTLEEGQLGLKEQRAGRRSCFCDALKATKRAARVSRVVYGVWRISLLDRLQWLLSSPAFICRTAEQTNQRGRSQAGE